MAVMPSAQGCATQIDGTALPDYVARSFEAGILPSSDEPLPPERRTKAPGVFLRFMGGLGTTTKTIPT